MAKKILIEKSILDEQNLQPNKFGKLERIASEIRRCRVCQLGKSGLAVPGEGNPDSKILFLGEAPGKQEAKTGRPFIGRSGQLLRDLIKGIGLKEEDVFITSAVKYLPDRGTPTKIDIAHGRVHLFKQLEVIEPKIIVLLGSVAAQALIQEPYQVGKFHGQVINKDGYKLFPTYHPAAALRFPPLKKVLEEDFKKLIKEIKR